MTVWDAVSTLHTRQRIISIKCRINTAVSPDDGPIVARNMYGLIKIHVLITNCAPSWFYLQDYTQMHGQKTKNKDLTL
jgi:hypothetical protein